MDGGLNCFALLNVPACQTVLEEAMLRNPRHWQKYYHGSPQELAFARKYSLSDRSRYYWSDVQVQAAFSKLLANLSARPLPLALLSQFAPEQLPRIRDGKIENNPEAIILDHIDRVLAGLSNGTIISQK